MQLPLPMILSATLLSGCATVVTGTTQTVDVRSYPPGAQCTLARAGMVIATVDETPQSIEISRSLRDVELRCSKPGYDDGHGTLRSDMHEAALGNVFVGGAVGGAVDAATGAIGQYRSGVRVSLRKLSESEVAAVEEDESAATNAEAAAAKSTREEPARNSGNTEVILAAKVEALTVAGDAQYDGASERRTSETPEPEETPVPEKDASAEVKTAAEAITVETAAITVPGL